MKLFILILLLVRFQTFGQERDLSSYLPNAVDLGGSNFGIITGEVDENTLSFITVGDRNDSFFSGISVKFFNSDFEETAYLVNTFDFGKYTLALYQCDKPQKLPWRSDHYDFFSSNSNSFRTFLDNGRSDNQWSNYREPVSLVNLSNEIASLRMRSQSYFSRGMPILNDRGSVVGMIASRQSAEQNVTFEAIDFSVIERLLYEFGKCKYFKLIPFGHKMTLCAKEEKENLYRKQEKVKSSRQNRSYGFTAAPAFNLGVLILPSENEAGWFGGFGYKAGVNLFFWPDQSQRVSLKPKYSNYRVGPSGGTTFIVGDTEFIGLQLQSFEIPLMLEFVMNYKRNKNQVFAVGYVPNFPYQTNLIHIIDGRELMSHMNPTSSVFHKLMVELTFENRISRWGFYYATQLNRWVDPNFELRIENEIFRPFEGQKSVSHYFGAEFSWRLWGNWLLKEK